MINKTYIKFYPAEYHSQSAIDAALTLRPQLPGGAESIERITIETFNAAVEIIGGEPEKWRPTTRETADHSLPYCVAVALIDGQGHAELVRRRAPGRREPAGPGAEDRGQGERRTEREVPGRHSRTWSASTCATASVLEKEVTFPRGHARNPMTDAEVEAKFRSLAEPLLPESAIAEILDRCWNLDKQTDIGELLRLFQVDSARTHEHDEPTRRAARFRRCAARRARS